MTKSLQEQLADLEDAETRLRPLVVEAHQAIKDLRQVEKKVHESIESWQKKALEIASAPVEQQVEAHIKAVVDQELEQFINDLGKKQHALYKQVENAFDQLTGIFLGYEDDGREDLPALITRLGKKKREGIIGKEHKPVGRS